MEKSTHLELSSESLNSIRTVLGTMRDVPPEFIEDMETWAHNWPHRSQNRNAGAPAWQHIRPYRVCELAKLPGMPGETTIYKILNELPEDKRAMARNLAGMLTPEIVEWIFKKVSKPKIVGGGE